MYKHQCHNELKQRKKKKLEKMAEVTIFSLWNFFTSVHR